MLQLPIAPTLSVAVMLASALALTLGPASSIQAQEANQATGALPPWGTESAKPDPTKDIPTDEALLRQHLAGGDAAPPGTAVSAQKIRPVAAGAIGSGAAPGSRDDAGNSIAAAVKDFVKPLNHQINNSGLVQAVRDVDAVVGGRARADGSPGAPVYGQLNPDAAGSNQAGTKANRKSDPNAAALMWENFLDEVLPWAAGGLVVGMFGYGGYVWLKLIKLKRLKQGDKRRAARRGRHTSRSTSSHLLSGTAPVDSTLNEAAALAPNTPIRGASSGSSRSSSSSPRRSSGRSSGLSSNRSSSRTSGGSSL